MIRCVISSVLSAESAIRLSKHFGGEPHVAGTDRDLQTARDFVSLFQKEMDIPAILHEFDAGSPQSQQATRYSIQRSEPFAWIDTYYPVLNSPVERAVQVLDDSGSVLWDADVDEPLIEGDPAGKYARDVPAWHALSATGDVAGPAIYVNYGLPEDFAALRDKGVNLTGTIAVARYGRLLRGLKVKAAQEAGCIGILIYTDLRDGGVVTEVAGYKPWPYGPALNPHAVQRGSVEFANVYPGDPTTPGYPSYPNATRVKPWNLPSIPSLPISWANGKKLLETINPESLFSLDGCRSEHHIRLVNRVEPKPTPVWNTMAVIPGMMPEGIIVIGNHRDAWGPGAGDPTSGTVVLAEIVRGLGALIRSGKWLPLKTIMITTWDAEEFGLMGSTEYGEDFSDFIKEHVVAYLNVDMATGGSRLSLNASPHLAHLMREVALDVPHPTDQNRTLFDARLDVGPFNPPNTTERLMDSPVADVQNDPYNIGVGPLDSGSDYMVFLQHIGVGAAEAGFGRTSTDAAYHYHSVYDSHQWQERYGDPGFKQHVAMAQFFGLLTIRMADTLVLPFNTTHYSLQLETYLKSLERYATTSHEDDFARIGDAIADVTAASLRLDKSKEDAGRYFRHLLSYHRPKYNSWSSLTTYATPFVDVVGWQTSGRLALDTVDAVNAKLAGFERQFLSKEGLRGREWFRHLGMAPDKWLGYDVSFFPSVAEALEEEVYSLAGREGVAAEVDRLVGVLNRLAAFLDH
ncbi:Zn-dependent exopeptidase [Clavulina sp. PMI_390]|nr:Zn-dependent exopeptidase [Clavulina sp. PMI_390]